MSVKKSSTIIFLALVAVAAIPLAVPEFLPFGEGTSGSTIPGNQPFVPDLQGFGVPSPGSQVNLFLMNCRGDQPGYMIVGTSRKDRPFFGGTLYPAVGTAKPIWITALGGSPPIGYWSHTGLDIPISPSLSGVSLYLQAITKDPGNPYGATLSNGLEMRIQ